jgi:hypothetical protein
VRAAVHDVGDAVRLAASDGDRHCRKVLIGVQVAGRRVRGQAGQEDQLGRLSTVQWQLCDALVVDDLTHAGAVCLDHAGIGSDRHLLAHLPEGKRDVDLGIGADLEDDAISDVSGEPREDDFHLIRANRQVRQRVAAIAGGEHGSSQTGVGLRDRDFSTWQYAAARVAHDAGYLRAGDRLRIRQRNRRRRQRDDAEHNSCECSLPHRTSSSPATRQTAGGRYLWREMPTRT